MALLLGFRRSTGDVIPDFQERATAEVLTANAVRAGIPENDVEIRTVTRAEFAALVRPYQEAAAQQEADRKAALRLKVQALRTRLSLTNDDMAALRFALLGDE